MDLTFTTALAARYRSASQRARVLSEDWVGRSFFCPHCGRSALIRHDNNSRIADFLYSQCDEQFEVKSLSQPFRDRVEDGEYRTMLARVKSNASPNLFLLHYDRAALTVVNFIVIPKHFLRPECIEARNPLAATARRAGWIGCRIRLSAIPSAGQIFVVRDRVPTPAEQVLTLWKQTLFLRDETDVRAKGWLIDVMQCIDRIGSTRFTLDSVYAFEATLQRKYPENRHVRAKIRQQLQVLRDQGYLAFIGQGAYRFTPSG